MPIPQKKKKIVVVCGPTATGKSHFATALAREFGGQVIGADSMQIYKGLVVGTAAPTACDISHHLVGFLPPEEKFSVAGWVKEAGKVIDEITQQGDIPVVCGGTGLYINSLVNGISFTEEKTDETLRETLLQQWDELGACVMLENLRKLDAQCTAKLHINDKKRIIRALELYETTGKTEKERNELSIPSEKPYNALLLGLNYESRATLYEAINARVDAMMKAGLLEEAELVWQNRHRYITAAQAIGYKEFFAYFSGETPLSACVDKLKQATRNYAKRQLTWFGHMQNINWLCVGDEKIDEKAFDLVKNFLV